MVNSWGEKAIEDLPIHIGDGNYSNKYPRSKDFVEQGIPFISAGDLVNGRISSLNLRYISEEQHATLLKGHLKKGDVLITTRGWIGNVAFVTDDFHGSNINAQLVLMRADNKVINNKYLYYLLSTKEYKQLFLAYSSGSAQPQLPIKALKLINIRYPDVIEQKAIAHILGTLDDKIELNRQMNETLEAMAQALFKSWFVDFDPVIDNALLAGNDIPEPLKERAELRQAQLDSGKAKTNSEINDLFPSEFEFTEELGWIPKGWSVSMLGNESEFSNGYAFKSKELSSEEYDSYHVFKMGHIKRGGGFNPDGTKSYYPKVNATNLEKYLLKKGDILMAMTDMKASMALLGHTALMPVNNKYLLNQRVGRLRVSDDSALNYPYIYIYSNLQTTIEEIRSRSNSGVQVNLSTSEIKATPILVPSKEAHDLFNKVAVDLFNTLFSNDDSSDSLAKLRDTLLPKLMSGELRIADAEKLAENI